MRGLLLGALLLGGLSHADDKLSGEQVQMIMSRMAPMFTTLTVCISGNCTAAFECGIPPSFNKRPDGSIRVFMDCDEFPDFICANGVTLREHGNWCQLNYPSGNYFRVTLLNDGFKIEDVK